MSVNVRSLAAITFLQCQYSRTPRELVLIACRIGAGLQKPNLLKHTSHMTEWARNLKNEREYDSDETISHLISLRQLDDQVQDTLFTGIAKDLPLSDARTLMHVRFLESQLDQWRSEAQNAGAQRCKCNFSPAPTFADMISVLKLSSSFTDMLMHSVALRPSPEISASATADSTQLNAMLTALEAGKRFLDALLSYPAHEYHLISFSEWMRLPTVIMTVAKLCMPNEAHGAAKWDVKMAQDRVRLDLCLESLCYRMQQLSTYDKSKQTHPDFWFAMRWINDLTKAWFIRRIKPNTSSQPTPSGATGNAGSEESGTTSGALPTPSTDQEFAPFSMGANSVSLDIGAPDDNDPFAFMKDIDFDMAQFMDMGIWGDDTYNSMGFGGGMSF